MLLGVAVEVQLIPWNHQARDRDGARRYLAGRRRDLMRVRNLLVPAALAFVPMVLVLEQPDLGTALSFPFILFAMLYWSGLPMSYLALLASPLASLLTAFSPTSWGLFALGFAFTLYSGFRRFRLQWMPVLSCWSR